MKNAPNEEERKDYGNRIKFLRQSLNLTTTEFGKRIFTSPVGVSWVENGRECWTPTVSKLISYEFGVSLNWILNGVAEVTDREEIRRYAETVTPVYTVTAVSELIDCHLKMEGAPDWSEYTTELFDYMYNVLKRNLPPSADMTAMEEKLISLTSEAYGDGFTNGFRHAIALAQGVIGVHIPIDDKA